MQAKARRKYSIRFGKITGYLKSAHLSSVVAPISKLEWGWLYGKPSVRLRGQSGDNESVISSDWTVILDDLDL